MTLFEKARDIIMTCAYKKGMWESVLILEDWNRMYKNIIKHKIAMYGLVIEACYLTIAELRKSGSIK